MSKDTSSDELWRACHIQMPSADKYIGRFSTSLHLLIDRALNTPFSNEPASMVSVWGRTNLQFSPLEELGIHG